MSSPGHLSVAPWYFGERDPSAALKPVGLRDALGPSLGSICCGSTVSGVVGRALLTNDVQPLPEKSLLAA